MDRKAREDLEAAGMLLQGDPCTNVVASRAYYAVYHAAWAALMAIGIAVPASGRKRYFRHGELSETCLEHGLLDVGQADDLLDLLSDRIIADYSRDPIGVEQAGSCLASARAIVTALIGDEDVMP